MEAQSAGILSIFLTAMISENMALYFFLGICPLITLSVNFKSSLQMGVTVTIVMLITSTVNYALYSYLLMPLGIEFLQLLFFVVTIAAIVQLIEGTLDRFFPEVHSMFGIFLPLLTVNCAILGVSMFMVLREYNLVSSLAFAAGSGAGWTLAICLMAVIRARIDEKAVSPLLGQNGLVMIIAAILAMGFSGLNVIIGVGMF